MRNLDFDRAVTRLALRQHGAFHHKQLRSLGGTATMIDDRVANGTYVRLAPRVLALASQPATWRRQYKAAELSIPGSALADRAALHVHGIEGGKVLRPVLAVPYTSNVRSPLADIRRCADVSTTEVDRIRVTTAAQTLVDVVACWKLRPVEAAWDDALLRGLVTTEELEARVAVAVDGRRPHGRQAEALLVDRRATEWVALDSLLELLASRLLSGLPPGVTFVHQATMPWWQPGEGRVDLFIPAWRLIIELDGRRWHARVAAFDTDRWRDNVAAANGCAVLRFTHAHLTLRADEVLALILEVGRHRLALAS
jgi:very-short-patch-repair endonuclease